MRIRPRRRTSTARGSTDDRCPRCGRERHKPGGVGERNCEALDRWNGADKVKLARVAVGPDMTARLLQVADQLKAALPQKAKRLAMHVNLWRDVDEMVQPNALPTQAEIGELPRIDEPARERLRSQPLQRLANQQEIAAVVALRIAELVDADRASIELLGRFSDVVGVDVIDRGADIIRCTLHRLVADADGLTAAAYVSEQTPATVKADTRRTGIMPTSLAMVEQGTFPMSREALFQPAGHVGPSGWLPGFEHRDVHGPVFPLELYDLLNKDPKRRGSAASLALRIFVEAVLSVMHDDRERAIRGPVAPAVTLREFLNWFYGSRPPRPREYWPALMAAAEALDRHEARFPWCDPQTGRSGLRRVASLGDIPRGPGALDDVVSLLIHLPPGSTTGPPVNRARLRYWGRKSEAAYRAMIGLAYRWFRPGYTRLPVRNGAHWVQTKQMSRYDELTDGQLIELFYPTSQSTARRTLLKRARDTAKKMAVRGDIRIDGRRLLPGRTAMTLPDTESDVT